MKTPAHQLFSMSQTVSQTEMDRCENYSTKLTGKIGRNIYPLLLAVFGPFRITFK